jgi:hypothetical protein
VTSVQARSTGYKGFLTYHEGELTFYSSLTARFTLGMSRLNSQEC